MRFYLTLLAFLMLTSPAFAFTEEEFSGEKTMTIQDYIKDFVDIPEGGTDWKVFGTTKEIQIETKTDDGYELVYSKPEFAPEVKALDGQKVIIKGYMFPLDGTEQQRNFLFGPFPLSCPFRYHVGPPLVFEVHAAENPVIFDYDPITITGILELVPDDPEYNVFYRLKEAKQLK